MDYILNKKFDGTFSMNFIGYYILTQENNTLYLKIPEPITGIKSILSVNVVITGEKEWQYVKAFFRYQNKYDNDLDECGDCWSEMIPLSGITSISTIVDRPFDLELYFFRIDDPPFDAQHPRTPIYIGTDEFSNAITIEGEYEFNWTDGPFTLVGDIDEIVFSPADIYKIFSVSDFMIRTDDVSNLELHYRVTQDNGRTYSMWEPLNKANISTYKFNTLRFAKLQYKVKLIYPSDIPNNIYDIILIGDFQNVSANYLKTNRYGIRQDCITEYINGLNGSSGTSGDGGSGGDGNNVGSGSCSFNVENQTGTTYGIAPGNGTPTRAMNDLQLNMNFWSAGLSCYSSDPNNSNGTIPSGGVTASMTAENQANSSTLWNPYDITQIMSYANMLANQMNSIFAWEVDYHLTDPDSNGIDFILHEYQLYNIIDMKKLRVLVPDNKFPDNTVKFNQFSLDLFDTFEIHVLKDEFKRQFGIDKRPSENDIIFFCPINRMFYVKHSQVFRDVMNAGYYYKVILEKYEQKANIRNLNDESKALIDSLTRNTTAEDLFGVEKTNEENKIANLEQFKPFTFDPMRYVINNKVIRVEQDIYNGGFDVSKSHYDFKDVIDKTAVLYKKVDNNLLESSNRSIICWFNFNNTWNADRPVKQAAENYNVDQNKNFWLLDNYDETNQKGYRLWYFKKNINFQLNDQLYRIESIDLLTNIWYSIVINLEQRQKTVNMKVYTRDNDYNIIFFHPDTYEKRVISWTDTNEYTSLISAGYKPVTNEELPNNSNEYIGVKESNYENTYVQSFEHNADIIIKGSNIKYTNLRILNDVISNGEIFNVLNQFYIDNSEKIILVDNADRNIYTENYINKNWT